MQKPKLHPELQMQHKGCRWTCCSDLPIPQALYQSGMVLNPGGPESLKWSTSSALLCNSLNSSQKFEQTKILAQHSQSVISPTYNSNSYPQSQETCTVEHGTCKNVYGRTSKNVYGRTCSIVSLL